MPPMTSKRITTLLAISAFVITAGALVPARSLGAGGDMPQLIEIHSFKFAYTPSQITLKKGQTYKLHLTSDDVPHSLRIKDLDFKADMKVNEFNDVLFTPQQTGDFRADCGIYCGSGHKTMVLTVHVID